MSDMPPPPPADPGWSSQTPPQPGPSSHSPQEMNGWANLGTGDAVELAGVGARYGARVLDWGLFSVIWLPLMVISFFASTGTGDLEDLDGLPGVVLLEILLLPLAVLLYRVTFIAMKGQTLGKRCANIKVVRTDDGLVPGWGKSIGRLIIGLPWLVFISTTWDKARQGWHDKAAKTLVIKVAHSPGPSAGSNGHGIAGFVLGILSLTPLVGIVLGFIGIVLSLRGLNRSNHEGAPHRRLAKAGLVLSIVGTAVNELIWSILLAICVFIATFELQLF